MEYDVVIGLEVHAQLLTASKIFCGCSNTAGLPPNTNTCPVCMGMPGALPVLNEKVLEYGIRLGLALNCRITGCTAFARKNYFYPDLPKGYQISQHTGPLCEDGYVDIEQAGGSTKRIRIMRVHMEEDAGKTIHGDSDPHSYVDYNRSGVPLLEIVSMPDMSGTDEADAYLRELRRILMYLDICDGNMEEGSFRCDANVSVKPAGQARYGIRTEIKNMNSFRNIQKALDFEANRHIDVLRSGHRVVQETRLWNTTLEQTVSMRSKEESQDYLYFPEPDLMPFEVPDTLISRVREALPELPAQTRQRFRDHYGLPAYDAGVLTGTRQLAGYFEACARLLDAPKEISNWIMTEVMRVLNEQKCSISEFSVSPERLVELVGLVRKDVISGSAAKEVFAGMVTTGKDASVIVQEQGMTQVSDEEALKTLAREVIAQSPEEVKKYRDGKAGLLGFFVGRLMAASKGKANPRMASSIIKEMLE